MSQARQIHDLQICVGASNRFVRAVATEYVELLVRLPAKPMHLLIESLQDDKNLDQLKTHEYLNLIAGGNRRLSRFGRSRNTFASEESIISERP